jgi:MerR family transcriptional regulator, redox-sensitive transcriptional activator SoxR
MVENVMSSFTIGEVARQVGLTASALRYYERVGLVPPPPRSSKRRHYDAKAIGRIRIIMLARDAGFSVNETRAFLTDYPVGATPSSRWRALAQRKFAELDALMERVSQMKSLLDSSFRCDCRELQECERLIAAKHSCKKP